LAGFPSVEHTQSRHNMSSFGEWIQVLLDHVASGQSGAREFLMGVSAAGLSSGLSAATVQQALTAGETQTSYGIPGAGRARA